ncbi:MAG: ribosomal protein S18 acetylase RimI-like enzyme [Paraglaciecola sp.]|jgi:ribosomal protein S18 acetylase RimI-like enzyme
MSLNIISVDKTSFDVYLPQLADVLVDGVNSGASISFVKPLSKKDAARYWEKVIFPIVDNGERLLYVAMIDNKVVGTVQLVTELPPNQFHRCEVSKLIVHTKFRGNGIGKSLMKTIIKKASSIDKTLITLDTRTGDVSQRLYESLGFDIAGTIPDFALDPDGKSLSATTYMFKRI